MRKFTVTYEGTSATIEAPGHFDAVLKFGGDPHVGRLVEPGLLVFEDKYTGRKYWVREEVTNA